MWAHCETTVAVVTDMKLANQEIRATVAIKSNQVYLKTKIYNKKQHQKIQERNNKEKIK